jgi:tight adherence protein B
VKNRINDVLGSQEVEGKKPENSSLIKKSPTAGNGSSNLSNTFVQTLLDASQIEMESGDFLTLVLGGSGIIALALYLFDAPLWAIVIAGSMVAALPFLVLYLKLSALKKKFQEQLPDAIDLMVSVLKTGHSIPQAVRSVSKEAVNPLGHEFGMIMQRMNIGQPLHEALNLSAQKYQSKELDLICRAVTIQNEVGGSLAELLEKTNSTLRGRLKLKRQVKVLTSQSRLTGIIVSLLPIFLATALETLNPGYLSPLFETDTGKVLLLLAFVLQLTGMIIMKKMTEVKA